MLNLADFSPFIESKTLPLPPQTERIIIYTHYKRAESNRYDPLKKMFLGLH